MHRLLVAPLVLVLLVGCGGDDSLSKEEFIAEGDRLCREFEDRATELEEPQSPEELTEFLESVVSFTRQFRSDLADLDPPSGEGEDVHEAFLDAVDKTIEEAEASREAAADGDMQLAGERFEAASDAASSVDDELAEYGFEDCGENAGENVGG